MEFYPEDPPERDAQPEQTPYRIRYDPDGERALSTVVVEALEAAGGDVTDVAPLYESLDPDALDALFETRPNGTPRTRGEVSFVVAGYGVTVTADGHVVVRTASDSGSPFESTA